MRIAVMSLSLSLLSSVALAEGVLEAGFTVGAHAFSTNSELGVSDGMEGASPQSSALLGGRLSYAFIEQVVGELELVLVPTVDDRVSGASAVFGMRAQLRYEPFQSSLMGGKLHPFLLAGYGAIALRTDSSELKNDIDQAYEWGLGARYMLSPKMALRFDGRHLIIPDRTENGATSNFEITAGLTWHFGKQRRAPTLRERVIGAPGLVTTATGTPPANDGKSGKVAPVASAPTSPPPPPPASRVEAPVADPDADKDLLVDAKDRCPGEAETVNGYEDGDGCPDPKHPDMPAVPFARSSVGFSAESAAALEKTLLVLQQNQQLRIEIGGHSSSDESNKTLSLRRAEAVKAYLVARGIAEGRLRVLGYRDEQPVATDRAGRAKNRRVELRLLPLEP
jgi:outer membrane protein OmpA-like peptidoglycan-associated protein